jgi:hypothetical protein
MKAFGLQIRLASAEAGNQDSAISGLKSREVRRLRIRDAARIRRYSRDRGTDVAAKSHSIVQWRVRQDSNL